METVDRQNEKHDEVGDHHRHVESIGVVDAGKGSVSDLVPIVAKRVLSRDSNREERARRTISVVRRSQEFLSSNLRKQGYTACS